mmetsp:Transcript_53343/g.127612  ORF Transcript_53343/g.127612 Transcript_53343/m.127612 type:complete len:90 (+) Transcript_53343:61-330(+)
MSCRGLLLLAAVSAEVSLGDLTSPAPTTTTEASSWLSELGGGSVAAMVIAVSTVPACAFSLYKRRQNDGFPFSLFAKEEISESESDALS